MRKKLGLNAGGLAVASWRADIAATVYSCDYTHDANRWTTS